MLSRNKKNQNTLNLFLDNYFNALMAGALILFLVLAYLVFLGPKFRAVKAAIQANIKEQENLYAEQQKKLANLQSIVELYKKISQADLQKFNGVLPDIYVRERLFGELEEIIGRGGWMITGVKIIRPEEDAKPAPLAEAGAAVPGPATPNKKVGSINLELSVGAIDYAGFKNLLRILENNLRLFDVTDVNFSPADNTATIILTTYYYQSVQ